MESVNISYNLHFTKVIILISFFLSCLDLVKLKDWKISMVNIKVYSTAAL